jgi:catechol 2,3-dioxygenase-like lactoylglutathione lyase family enzyme
MLSGFLCSLQPSLLAGKTSAMSHATFEFDHIHIISQSPKDSANWYVQMFGADIVADTVAYGAPQIFIEIGGKTIIIRGQRSDESPLAARPIQPYANFSSHNAWGTDHFGFIYHGDLRAFCDELRAKGVSFPVPLKEGVGGRLLCYVSAPDGVSIELMQG